jgi:hypothetical protein
MDLDRILQYLGWSESPEHRAMTTRQRLLYLALGAILAALIIALLTRLW